GTTAAARPLRLDPALPSALPLPIVQARNCRGTVHAVSTWANPETTKPARGGLCLQLSWRRRRDSNPRCRFCPHTPLAGEHLRPLGHSSVGRDSNGPTSPAPRQAVGPAPGTWSRSQALCSARTASSMYFSSMTTLVLISLVVIIW